MSRISARLVIFLCFALALAVTSVTLLSANAGMHSPQVTYGQLIKAARAQMDQGKLDDAFLTASAAIAMDEKRWEAYAIAALVLGAQGNNADAVKFVDKAFARAPEEKKATLSEMKDKFGKAAAAVQKPAAASADALPKEARRKFEVLVMIAQDADKAQYQQERVKLLNELMAKNTEFVSEYPDNKDAWLMRAAVAIELDYPGIGWQAGKKLKALGLADSDDPKVGKVMAQLERKGWLGGSCPRRDWSKSTTEQLKAVADAGDADAQAALGDAYYNGSSGLASDNAQAVAWYRKAAEQGSADGQASLGMMYLFGEGVADDDAEAVKWARKAAEQDNAVALSILGFMYSKGRGVAEDEAEAAKWTAKAEEAVKSDEVQKKRIAEVDEKLKVVEAVMRGERHETKNVKDGSELVFIPAGAFMMGCDNILKSSGERPYHQVNLDGYYIGKYEVTVAQYRAFCNSTSRRKPAQPSTSNDDCPVVNVCWDDAAAYCDWAGLRLPTEAEWEKATRGGTDTDYWWGNRRLLCASNWDEVNSRANVGDYVVKVGSYAPNPFGLFDMSGNAGEWCSDWFDGNYYEDSPTDNPKGPDHGEKRVFREGLNLGTCGEKQYSFFRFSLKPGINGINTGFRVAKDAPTKKP